MDLHEKDQVLYCGVNKWKREVCIKVQSCLKYILHCLSCRWLNVTSEIYRQCALFKTKTCWVWSSIAEVRTVNKKRKSRLKAVIFCRFIKNKYLQWIFLFHPNSSCISFRFLFDAVIGFKWSCFKCYLPLNWFLDTIALTQLGYI